MIIARIIIHQKKAGIRQIINIQKLTTGFACAPADDLIFTPFLCFIKAPDQGRDDMRIIGMVVVLRSE